MGLALVMGRWWLAWWLGMFINICMFSYNSLELLADEIGKRK
jgi:hypothetical protein